ncbi:hypothetical protein BDM02DRAFT_3262147 [Thelephora ganbajun]|uniref:Uncharacterized protein n=1 Tax=Thelephora ganbajun TaxID=370292 RepID=A0ACB6ZAU5_THEGA|nr:hypothetical protein BDM02DRAFT_3262147 [Thelephora ganbajun]
MSAADFECREWVNGLYRFRRLYVAVRVAVRSNLPGRCPTNASFVTRPPGCSTLNILDWGGSQTDLANLAGAGVAGSAAGGDKLWEDNWGDDDIEGEFSTQLRKDKIEIRRNAALTARLIRVTYVRIPNLALRAVF